MNSGEVITGISDIPEDLIRKFVKKTDISASDAKKILELLIEYAYVYNDKIQFTPRGKALSLSKQIVIYSLAKYLAWKLKQEDKLDSYGININDPFVTVKELSTALNRKYNIVTARLTELKGILVPLPDQKGIYKIDPLTAYEFLTKSQGKKGKKRGGSK